MTNEGQRTTIEPEDWPLEESSTGENALGQRSDIGVSGAGPLADETDPADEVCVMDADPRER